MTTALLNESDVIEVTRARRVSAIVDQSSTLKLTKAQWESAVREAGGDESEAFGSLLSPFYGSSVTCVDSSTTVDEVTQVFDSEITLE